MQIFTLCGAGIGTSAILKVSVERVLKQLGIEADVTATNVADVRTVAADAQVILTSAEHRDAIGPTFAEVIVVDNILDLDELSTKLEAALG